LISTAGYFVGDNWRLVVEYVRAYGRWMVILLSIVAVIVLVRWYFGTDEPADGTGTGDGEEEAREAGSSVPEP
jgi:hypothetical protein